MDQHAANAEWKEWERFQEIEKAKDAAETLALELDARSVLSITDSELSSLFRGNFEEHKFLLYRVLLEMGIHIDKD